MQLSDITGGSLLDYTKSVNISEYCFLVYFKLQNDSLPKLKITYLKFFFSFFFNFFFFLQVLYSYILYKNTFNVLDEFRNQTTVQYA